MDFASSYSVLHKGVHGELVVNPVDFPVEKELALAHGEFRPDQPIRFVHHMGSRLTDFLLCGFPVISLVSEKFLRVLQERNFSGWRIFPVEIFGRDKQRIDGYHGLSITGRCGPIDNTKSERKTLPPKWPAVRAVPAWYGLYFDLSTWDGSDLFMPEGTGFIFVSEAVKSALEKAKLTNLHFTRLTEVERLVL